MYTHIKIYGEWNTNTNYFSELVTKNLKIREIDGIIPRWLLKLQGRAPGKEWLKDLYFFALFPKT